jgi:hypothetical protein
LVVTAAVFKRTTFEVEVDDDVEVDAEVDVESEVDVDVSPDEDLLPFLSLFLR